MDSGKDIRRIAVLLLSLSFIAQSTLRADAFAVAVPQLYLIPTQNVVVVSWPLSASDWVLEAAPHLQSPVPWRTVSTSSYKTNGTNIYIAASGTNGPGFYRLRKFVNIAGATGSWRLDNPDGSEAFDESGLGVTLSLTNTSWVTGNDLNSGSRAGFGALHFNGGPALGNGSRAWINNEAFRVLPASGRPFSVSLWFSPDALTSGWRGIVGNDVSGSNGWKIALNTPAPGTNYLAFVGNPAASSLSVTGRILLLPRQWYHLTATYDGAEGSLYVNGTLLAQSPGTLATHDGPIYVGGGVGQYDSFLGRIDELRTYTNCLSYEQIALTGEWHFDEDDGSVALDSSGNEHHARLSTSAARGSGKNGGGIDVSLSPIVIRNDDFTLLPETGGAFSISFWLKPYILPIGRSGLMTCSQATDEGWELTLDVDTSEQVWLSFASINNGGTLNLRVPLALSNHVWTKLDLTYNGGIATLYANGRKLGTDSGGIRAGRGPLVIGAAPGTLNFNGVIDELKIYRRERNASEIGPVAPVMWETVLLGGTTNIVLQGSCPPGKTLTYAIVDAVVPTNGMIVSLSASGVVTYQAGSRKGPDAFAYTVSDGEFITPPNTVCLSIVQPHWLSPDGGAEPRDGSTSGRAWKAGAAHELDAIWKTNNYYDCFFYAPGLYQTTGWKYLERSTANPGCKHIGSGLAGPQKTTVQLVNIIEAWGEETIFRMPHHLAFCDGFEVHNMVLDCNAHNVPKYVQGEPVRIRVPLTTTGQVETVTLHWADNITGRNWHLGRAPEFKVSTRAPTTDGYITNSTSHFSTSQVDRISVGAATDEILIELNRRAAGVDFYSLTEIEVAGPRVSLPSATTSGSTESRLYQHPTNSILRAVDGDGSSAWTSGSETNVEISLPLQPGTLVSQINLHWNCQVSTDGRRTGAASNYVIRAKDPNTGLLYDVPFIRHARSTDGLQANSFGTAQSTNSIVTDQIVISLTARESGVDYYGLRELTLQNFWQPLSLRVPTSSSTLPYGAAFSILQAFDGTNNSQWACDTQGAVTAINATGNNMKFTNLRIINFGSKAARECFPLFVFSPLTPPATVGNILMENCDVSQAATNNTDGLTAVLLHGNRGGLTNGIVRRCTVKGVKPHFPVFSHGFVANHVENCYVEDCAEAVYFEPEPAQWEDYGPVFIRSNRFINVDNGIYLLSHPDGKFRSLIGIDNEIVLNNWFGWGFFACDTCYVGTSGTMTNVTMLNNIVRATGGPTGLEGGLNYSDIQHAVFGNNVIDLGPGRALRVRQCPAGRIVPNVSNCEQPGPPPPPFHPPCLDTLPAGYRRVWYNNRDLSGTLLDVRFLNNGVDGLSSQQQWP